MVLDAHEVITYSTQLGMAAQQRVSRLKGACMYEPIAGAQRRWRAYGAAEMVEIMGRAAPTKWQELTRLQRTITRKRWGLPILMDPDDDEIVLQDFLEPNTAFWATLMAGSERAYDRQVIAAFDGTAYGGDDGTTAVAFDTANQDIVHGSASLTLGKVRDAMVKLDTAEYPDEDRFFLAHPTEIGKLLLDTSVSANSDPIIASINMNQVKALVEGEIDYFMRFKWIRSSLLTRGSTASHRYSYAWHKSAMVAGQPGTAKIKEGDIAERNWAKGVGVYLHTAASRIFENGVVRIDNTVS